MARPKYQNMGCLMRRFAMSFVAALTLAACEGQVDLTVSEDATVEATSTMIMEQAACDMLLADGIEMCLPEGQESKTDNPLVYDAESQTYRQHGEIIAPGSALDELGGLDWDLKHDPAKREVSWSVPVTQFANMADGPARRLSGGAGEGMPAPIKALFDGKDVTFVVHAAEILESNGTISPDKTEVRFRLPSAYVYSGEGTPELTEFQVRLRY